MRREFSPISAVSMLMFFMAAVVICLQMAHAKVSPAWRLSSPLIWVVEITIFGSVVHLWRRRVSLGPWLIAIAALVLVRLGLTHASGAIYPLIKAGASYADGVREMSQAFPRVCAAFFSLVVAYPVRSLLPTSLLPARHRLRTASHPPAMAFGDTPPGGPNDPALWFVRGEEKIPVWLGVGRGGGDHAVSSSAATNKIDGHLDLSLRDVLAQIPQEFVSGRVGRYRGDEPVSLPLAVLLPQLREARIVVRLDDLCNRLPSDVVNLPDAWASLDQEVPLVLLPLELVVPKLPEGALELPPASPHAWAKLGYSEKVVFARS